MKQGPPSTTTTTEPLRLLDGAGDDAEIALLRAAESAPPPGARERTTALFERGAGVLLSAEAGRVATRSRWTWLGWGSLGVTMIAFGLWSVRAQRISGAGTDTPSAKGRSDTSAFAVPMASAIAMPDEAEPRSAPMTARAPEDVPPRPSSPAQKLLPSVAAPRGSISVAHGPSSPPTVAATATASSKGETDQTASPNLLAEEVAAIDGARAALRVGDAPKAQRALDAYQQRFPHGVLGPEATLLRVEALLATGDRATARELAQRFIERNASGAYVGRMRSLLEKHGVSPSP